MPCTTIHEAELHYEVDGDGRRGLAVLLHANPGDLRDYDGVVASFHAAGFRTLRLDWPGYGRSAPLPGRASAMRFATVLDELLAQVATGTDPLVLVGNSVGGFAAVRYALSHPDEVAALVLVSPGGFTRHNTITRAFCRLMSSPRWGRRLVGPLATAYTLRRTPHARAVLRRARQVARDPSRLAVHCEVWGSFTDPQHDLRAAARQLAAPTLLTWGAFDPVLPRITDGRNARRAIPRSRMTTFPSGHEPHAESPRRWWGAVAAFLDEAVPAEGDRAEAR